MEVVVIPTQAFENLPHRGETSPPQAFREGGEDGVVEGLAPVERRLPPPEDLGRGVERLKYFRLKYKYIDPIHNSHRSSSFCSTSSRHAPSLKWIPPSTTPASKHSARVEWMEWWKSWL